MVALSRSKLFYYLASPYTHKSPLIREQRFLALHHYAGMLMAHGYFVYAPILNTHRIAQTHDLPMEYTWWKEFNDAFVDASAGVIVADIDGWKESAGVQYEIRRAIDRGLPVWVLSDTGELTEWQPTQP